MYEHLKRLVAESRIDEALKQLAELLPAQYQTDAIMQQARLNSLKQKERLGVITGDESRIERARITQSILALIDILAESSPSNPVPVNPPDPPVLTDTRPSRRPDGSPTQLFISYAHKDELYKDELITQLKVLKRKGIVKAWEDRAIKAGEEWDSTIKGKLLAADIIIFLVSSDFMASDYIHDVELKNAIERYKNGECTIVPIIIRPCHFQDLDIGKFQALPTGAKPISTWANRDEAWYHVLGGLKNLLGV